MKKTNFEKIELKSHPSLFKHGLKIVVFFFYTHSQKKPPIGISLSKSQSLIEIYMSN